MDTLRTLTSQALETVFCAIMGILFVLCFVAFWLVVAGAVFLALWETWAFAVAAEPALHTALAALFPSWDAWSVFAAVAANVLAYALPALLSAFALLAALSLVFGGDEATDHDLLMLGL